MLPDINLLPNYERQNSRLYYLFLIGLVLCLLLFGLIIWVYINTKSSLAEAEQTLQNLNQDKTLLEQELATVNTGDQMESIEGVVSYAENHIVPTSYFMDELIDLLPKHGYLSSFNYNYQNVNIETQFERMSDAAAYIVALSNSEYVTDVEINQLNTFEQGMEEIEEVREEAYYDTIPRYNVSYSIDVHHANLREAGERDE